MDILQLLGSYLHGAERALQAYTGASDAYADADSAPPVAFWALLIAALVVVLEWAAARYRRGRR